MQTNATVDGYSEYELWCSRELAQWVFQWVSTIRKVICISAHFSCLYIKLGVPVCSSHSYVEAIKNTITVHLFIYLFFIFFLKLGDPWNSMYTDTDDARFNPVSFDWQNGLTIATASRWFNLEKKIECLYLLAQ